jgi:hypothetical protein
MPFCAGSIYHHPSTQSALGYFGIGSPWATDNGANQPYGQHTQVLGSFVLFFSTRFGPAVQFGQTLGNGGGSVMLAPFNLSLIPSASLCYALQVDYLGICFRAESSNRGACPDLISVSYLGCNKGTSVS